MNKKGFTLIELLAVILIVTIISTISIPMVTNYIVKANLKSVEKSAYGIIDVLSWYYTEKEVDTSQRFDLVNGNLTTPDGERLEYKGKIEDGSMLVDRLGNVAVCINNGKYTAYKNYSDKEVTTVSGENCNIPLGTSAIYLGSEATITEYNNQELTNLVIELQQKVNELSAKSDSTPIGTIFASAAPTVPSGYILCDGREISRTTYKNLFDIIGTKYGSGDGTTTFNLPNYVNKFLKGATVAGTLEEAGLPNITGGLGSTISWIGRTGAFYNGTSRSPVGSGGYGVIDALFDASLSNPIYGKSTTVTPENVSVLYFIKY
ncbi:MAG: phage tail protein [Bacilli bacterium]|nr:phage tail protein [Bacilli bacterium]